jgi:glycolate oxidase iron-sulfur subunit
LKKLNLISNLTNIIEDCVHCGLCLSSCPTYLTSGLEAKSPRGRLLIMNQINKNSESLDIEMVHHLNTCLDCRGCETACPSGVEYHLAFQETKNIIDKYYNLPFLPKLILNEIKNKKILPILKWVVWFSKKFKILPVLSKLGIKTAIQGNSIPIDSFQDLKKIKPEIHKTIHKSKGLIGLYTGCIMNEWFIKIHKSTINVLNKLGYDVFIPKNDICCGALHQHSGDANSAQQLKNKNEDLFKNCDFVVVNSAGCSAELKSHNSKNKYLDIIEFLNTIDLRIKMKLNKNIIWDSPCHLSHAQKLASTAMELFEKIKVEPLSWAGQELCCGGAGNYTLIHPKDSDEILKLKYYQLLKYDFDYLVTSNPGCHLQLEKGRQIYNRKFKIIHFIELIEMVI